MEETVLYQYVVWVDLSIAVRQPSLDSISWWQVIAEETPQSPGICREVPVRALNMDIAV